MTSIVEETELTPEPAENVNCDRTKQFITLLTSHQPRLYVYISTMLFGDSAAAADVLQDTNLDLWSQANQFDLERPFLPWAFGFARQRVRAYRKKCVRSRLVFDDETLDLISAEAMRPASEADARLTALETCLKRLTSNQAELIRERYVGKMSVKTIAERLSESAHNITSRLHRIRKILARCIEQALAIEER